MFTALLLFIMEDGSNGGLFSYDKSFPSYETCMAFAAQSAPKAFAEFSASAPTAKGFAFECVPNGDLV